MMEERLNKFLAECGVCSRRDADKLIEDGRVKVNNQTAVMGMKVCDSDFVTVNDQPVHSKNEKVVLAYNKPRGVTCTEKDRFADKKITDMIHYPIRVTYAGRLDKESEGLILLTNDGELIDDLMRGSKGHEKEYEVKISKEVTEEFIDKMSGGIFLKEVNIKTRPCKVTKTGKFSFDIILTEGVNRQIRRMCETQNCYVTHLKRVRVANITLANLKIGEFRKIEGIELQALYKIARNEM